MGASLTTVLDTIGMKTHMWESPDGSRAVLLPHGGRVLALYSPNSEDNFFWTHSALEDSRSARAFYAGTQWHNSGGDRTWLAPEYDLFYPSYPRSKPYFQPRQLDPGNYQLSTSSVGATLQNDLCVRFYASGQTVQATIQKSLAPAANPLLCLPGWRGESLDYAGYTLRTALTLQVSAEEGNAALGMWNLLQLPHRGELIFATHSRAAVVHYMGSIARKDLVVSEHAVRYRMRSEGEQKIGIEPVFVTGRGAYLYGTDENASLVVRNFIVNPSGRYVDVPFSRGGTAGCAAQACNVNSNLGAFSELEYHTPAITTPAGPQELSDESQLWAFRGPRSAVLEAARLLVSPELSLNNHAESRY